MHKAAVNIGRRPTVDAAGADITVEAHLLHAFAGDFYGRRLRVVLCGCACCTDLTNTYSWNSWRSAEHVTICLDFS